MQLYKRQDEKENNTRDKTKKYGTKNTQIKAREGWGWA